MGTAGCNPNSLDGSIKDKFPLDFQKVEVIQQVANPNLYLAIQYDNGAEKPCKLTLNVAGLNLKSNSTISGPQFLNTAVFKRIANDPNDYSTLLSGSITFSSYSTTLGSTVAGQFSAVFLDSFDIIGNFSAALTGS